MNCCNDFGQCTRGENCPARAAAMQVTAPAHIDMTGLSLEDPNQAPATQPDTQDAGRDVQPDYMPPWEWMADLGRSTIAAAIAVAIVGIGLGFITGRWVL